MYTCFKICRIRTVRASDFFFSSLWPVLAPLSLVLVAAKVLLRTSPTQRRAARKLRSAPCLSPTPPRRFVAAGRYQPKHAAGGHSHSRRKNLLAAHLHAALSQDKRSGTCTRAPAVSGASAAREAASSDGSQKGDAASASAAAAAPARPCPQRTRQRSTRRLDPAPRHARHAARAPPVRRLLTASPPLRSVPPCQRDITPGCPRTDALSAPCEAVPGSGAAAGARNLTARAAGQERAPARNASASGGADGSMRGVAPAGSLSALPAGRSPHTRLPGCGAP